MSEVTASFLQKYVFADGIQQGHFILKTYHLVHYAGNTFLMFETNARFVTNISFALENN